jgi:hypothetical protein
MLKSAVRSVSARKLAVLLAAGLLSACSGDNLSPSGTAPVVSTTSGQAVASQPVNTSQQEILLNITDNKFNEADTRAIIIYSTDSLRVRNKDIARIDAFYHLNTAKYLNAARIRYDGTNWLFHTGSNWTKYYWPIPNSHDETRGVDVDANGTLDFAGYIPYTIPHSDTPGEYSIALDGVQINPPKFTCSLPITIPTPPSDDPNTFGDAEQSTLQEFLFAYLPNQTTSTQSAAGGKLNLPFQHPFALVNFYLKEAKRGTIINKVTLKSGENGIKGIKTKGTYTYGGTPAWTFDGTEANNYPANLVIDFTPGGKEVPNVLNFNGLIGGPYVVLPQDLTGSTKNLIVNRTYDESTDNILGDIATTWQPGKIYNYYLDLGKDENQILLDVVVQDWVTQEYKIPIDIY